MRDNRLCCIFNEVREKYVHKIMDLILVLSNSRRRDLNMQSIVIMFLKQKYFINYSNVLIFMSVI